MDWQLEFVLSKWAVMLVSGRADEAIKIELDNGCIQMLPTSERGSTYSELRELSPANASGAMWEIWLFPMSLSREEKKTYLSIDVIWHVVMSLQVIWHVDMQLKVIWHVDISLKVILLKVLVECGVQRVVDTQSQYLDMDTPTTSIVAIQWTVFIGSPLPK